MEVSGQPHAPTALFLEIIPVPILKDATLAPKGVWIFLEKNIFLSTDVIRIGYFENFSKSLLSVMSVDVRD